MKDGGNKETYSDLTNSKGLDLVRPCAEIQRGQETLPDALDKLILG